MQKFHVGYIIDVDLLFQYDNEPATVEFYSQDRSWEAKLANSRLSLQ